MRCDEQKLLGAYERFLHPAVTEALSQSLNDGTLRWEQYLDEDKSALENARHTIEVHAQCRIAQALERLDYDDFDGFVALLGSAVGYLAIAVYKASRQTTHDEAGPSG